MILKSNGGHTIARTNDSSIFAIDWSLFCGEYGVFILCAHYPNASARPEISLRVMGLYQSNTLLVISAVFTRVAMKENISFRVDAGIFGVCR